MQPAGSTEDLAPFEPGPCTLLRCLRLGGWLAIEHGFQQGDAVRALFRDHDLVDPETRRDLAGLDQVTLAWAPDIPQV